MTGYLLMVSGWLLAVASLLLLEGTRQRLFFVLAALLVQLLGLGLVAYRYCSLQRSSE